MKKAKLFFAVVLSVVAVLAIGLIIKSGIHESEQQSKPAQVSSANHGAVMPVVVTPATTPTENVSQQTPSVTAENTTSESAPSPSGGISEEENQRFTPVTIDARPPMPDIRVTEGIGGEQAIKELGGNLAAVAAHYGKTEIELSNLLRRDSTLRLDGKANLYYEENNFPEPPETTQTGYEHQENTNGAKQIATANLPVAAATYPLPQTFLLHSKPGASKVIYLDFDGHTVSGAWWNSQYNAGAAFVQAPWDADGSPSTFSDAEKTTIQEVWKDVADAYAPFDVDVTTQDPGQAALTRSDLSDTQYGVRVVISHSNNELMCPGFGCSGKGGIGFFGKVGDHYQPAALVFSNYSNGTPDDRSFAIARGAIHEVGHTFGLFHDGTSGDEYYSGHGNWYPIMGGSYSKPIYQWSKGEYADANNQEDDLAIIAASVPYRVNDFGATRAAATPRGTVTSGAGITTSGIIAHTSELDFTSYTVPVGILTVTTTPSPTRLHAVVTLYNSAGAVLATSESVDSATGTGVVTLNNYFSAAGTVYVSVSGKGTGDPLNTGYSAYGSLGNYDLSLTTSTIQTITFPQPSNGNLGDAPYALAATASSNFPVAFTSTTPAVCTITGAGVVSLVAVGTCTINANQAGNGVIGAAAQVTRSFPVKTPQIITFSQPSDMLLSDASATLAATASSALAVAFVSGTSSVCTITTGGALTLVATGTCRIRAYQGGSVTYWAATPVDRTFYIRNFNQTITFGANPGPRDFGTGAFSVSATTTSTSPVIFTSITPTVCTVAGNVVTQVSIGNCVIAANAAMDANYLVAPQATQTIVFYKGTPVITFGVNPGPKVYGSAPFTVSATSPSTSPVIFTSATPSVCTVSGNAVSVVAAGSCVIAANAAGDANYLAAAQKTQTILINKASQNIVLGSNPGPKTFGDAPFTVAATTQSSSPIAFSSATPSVCSVSGSTVAILSAGNCSIAVDAAGDTNYLDALQKTQVIVINKVAQVITFDTNPGPRNFGTGAFSVSATTPSTSPVTFNSTTPAVCSVTGSVVTMVKVGNCIVAANAAADTNYLAAAQATQTIVINKGSQAITFGENPGPKTFGTGTFSVSATTPSTSPVIFNSTTPAVCNVVGSVVTMLSAGDCIVAANAVADTNYLVAPQVTQTITINQAAQTIVFNQPAPVALGVTTFMVAATGGASGNPVTFTSSTTSICTVSSNGTVTLLSIGSCTINADQAGNVNYLSAMPVSRTFAVLVDADNDGVADVSDNCPWVPNARQLDYNDNGVGDACGDPMPMPADILGIIKADKTGASVAFAGDFDGDGYGDYVVGIPGYDISAVPTTKAIKNAGRAEVISGKTGMVLAFTNGVAKNDAMGFSVAGNGDIDIDGYDDVVIGAPNAGVTRTGSVTILYGSANGTRTPQTVFGIAAKSHFGASVALGDINDDGDADIVIGAPKDKDAIRGLVGAGSVTVLSGGSLSQLQKFYGATANAHAGTGVATGKFDAVAGADILIGAPNDDDQLNKRIDAGSVSVYNIADSATPVMKKYGTVAKAYLGKSVAAGNVDGVVGDEVLAGAPGDDYGLLKDSGSVTVFFMDATPSVTKYGTTANAGLGNSVAAGDVNGDGRADIIAGASKDDKPTAPKLLKDAGSVSIWSGNGYAQIGSTLYGSLTKDYFGFSVSAGDINSDGSDDLIIGIPGFDAMLIPPSTKLIKDIGKVQVFDGGTL